MGAVWAATHTVTNKTVALKILLGREDPSLRARLIREARAVCAIRHPNVVQVHDVLELDDGAPALVMDLLVGESLRARLDRAGRLGHEDLARITLDVLAALEEAHARGIVHRDLKPDNIFLAEDGVKVLDFGIAKVTTLGENDAEAAALTRTDAMLGTPYYMAPEQVFGEKDIDPRADLWAMGVLMYECLAGVRPTEANNLGQIFKIITLGPIPPLAERAPLVPAAYASLVAWCMQRAREARPANARALREALERVRASGTMDGAEVAVYAPRPTKPSRLPAAIIAGVLGVAAIGGGAVLTLRATRKPPPTPAVVVAAPSPPPPVTSTAEPVAAPSETAAVVASAAPPVASSPVRAKAKSKAAAAAPADAPPPNDERAAGKVILKAPF